MHVFPQLRRLEEKYRDELVVIGVHSAKFPAERELSNLRKAVLRYRIEHPVVNDGEFQIFQQYACRAWPTIYMIDPAGRVMARHEGEIPLETFDHYLASVIQEFDEDGILDRRQLNFRLEQEGSSSLYFPGKLLADQELGRLFIVDSNHNRILDATLDGQVLQVIGSGDQAFTDGTFHQACFNTPQGVTLVDSSLYVADTGNHAIRRVDLERGLVSTVAGNGLQADQFHFGGPALGLALNSPWDLAHHNGTLYVAMAGFHQIWGLDLEAQLLTPYAGSGREGLEDGHKNFAQLAQTSGIVSNGDVLYFVDSESSSLRQLDVGREGFVRTIAGSGLFVFGDVDGVGDQVRLQHPLAVAYHDGILYVADSYNHKIKRVVVETGTSNTLFGNGEAGHRDGGDTRSVQFHEPSGLSVAGRQLFIADTNNHLIRVADLDTLSVSTLEVRGL